MHDPVDHDRYYQLVDIDVVKTEVTCWGPHFSDTLLNAAATLYARNTISPCLAQW